MQHVSIGTCGLIKSNKVFHTNMAVDLEHSGRVLNSRLKGRGVERHCAVSLSKTHLSLLSAGSPSKTRPDITEKLLTGT